MGAIEEAIVDARNAIKSFNNFSFEKYSAVYRTTNEDLKSMSKVLDIEGKKVLTVCGSGDQYFEFFSAGAENVTTFDINKLAYYYLILKKTAFSVLSKEEYISFFLLGEDKKSYLNPNIYNKIRTFLPNSIRLFWDFLYGTIPNEITDENGRMFISTFVSPSCSNISYIEKYDSLKEKIKEKEARFINTDIRKILYSITEQDKFDILYLSNIADYVPNTAKWIKFVMLELRSLLTKEGNILAHYKWRKDNESSLYKYYGFDEIELINLDEEEESYLYSYSLKNRK